MLIPSPRHTKADLDFWRELERMDAAHANSKMLGRNWRRCQEIVREFLSSGPAHVAVSWGKDSVVVAHLVHTVSPETPMFWIRVEPIKSPECEQVRDAFLRSHPRVKYGEVEVWCQRDEQGWHATGTLERGIREIEATMGKRTILGIRADESSQRRLRVFAYGPNTKNKSAPLSYLTGKDIFALLHSHRLPVHPAYGCLGGGRWKRDRLRVASLGGRRGDGIGRAEWEQEYYGAELRRLAAPADLP